MKRFFSFDMMFALLTLLFIGLVFINHRPADRNEKAGIRLIVRGDDIGCSHAANVACLEAYQQGILRSVEVMVPCPWFLEAAHMLRENPGLDVGVHITLTSEWDGMKWRPLTCAPSLVDSNGYFFPKQKDWSKEHATDAFWNARPKLAEIEQEVRAQIEMARKHIPQVSHLSVHMGALGPFVDSAYVVLYKRLAREYKLDIDPADYGVDYSGKYFRRRNNAGDEHLDLETRFLAMLDSLKPGTYLFVEHPGKNWPEMQAMGHIGNTDVAAKRDEVTRVFISERVKRAIAKRNIQLISYADLKR